MGRPVSAAALGGKGGSAGRCRQKRLISAAIGAILAAKSQASRAAMSQKKF